MNFSLKYRVWHWTLAISTISLFITVILRKTWFSWQENSNIILNIAHENKINMSNNVAIEIAKTIRDNMWNTHYILGFILLSAILLRIFIILKKEDNPPIIKLLNTKNKQEKLKYFVHSGICFFIMLITITGFSILFKNNLGLSNDIAHILKEIHEKTMIGLILFIGLHFAGIIKYEIKNKDSIISKMIFGK